MSPRRTVGLLLEHDTPTPGIHHIAGGQALEARLDQLRRTYRGRLAIDLSEVTFVSSSGIAVVVHAHRYAQHDGWVLELRQGPPDVRRVVQICGLADRLPFRPD
jgi:anti-anti-sigma factor